MGNRWNPISTIKKEDCQVLYKDGSIENIYWREERYCIIGKPQGSMGEGYVDEENSLLIDLEDVTHWRMLTQSTEIFRRVKNESTR